MTDDALLEKFTEQFTKLRSIVEESALRSISEPPDPLFNDNQNVFIKLYLVSACSILEAFIQDLASHCTDVMQRRVNALNIPYNFITWLADHDKAKLKFAAFEGRKTGKDISDRISPNYYKTVSAFERIGLNVASVEVSSYKDYISSIVNKRNNIVHKNDSASDLSYTDIITAINSFSEYSRYLHAAIKSDPHLLLAT